MKQPPTRHRWQHWGLALTVFLVSLSLIMVGAQAYRTQRDQIRAGAEAQLRAIGELRIEQIKHWLATNASYAQFFSEGGQVAEHFQAWQQSGYSDSARAERIRHRLAEYQAAFGYHSVSLFDTEGRYRLSLKDDPVMAEHRDDARRAIQSRSLVLIDFHTHGNGGSEPMLGFMAPLSVGHKPAQTVGAMFIAVPAAASLQTLIGRWPTPSPSGETVLVRAEGERLRMLFSSRHRDRPTAINLHPQSAAARVMRGDQGILKGEVVDYWGTPVLAYGSRVPGTPWVLVAKQDRAEIDAPARRLAIITALGVALLALLGGWLFWRWWLRLRRVQQAALLDKDVERRVLQRRYDFLSRYASDVIILADTEGRILEVNEQVERLYGYAPSEIKGGSIMLFRPPEGVDEARQRHDTVMKLGALTYEAEHQRKDGTRLPVEVSAHLIDIQGLTYFHLVFRDISERRANAQALLEREALYRGVIETSADGFWITDTDGHILEVNDAYCQRSGYRREELLDMRIPDLEARESPIDIARHMADLIRTGSGLFETVHRAKDGTAWQVEVNTSYSPLQGGRCFVFLRDVHQRNRSESLLRTRLHLSDLALTGGLDELMKASLDAAELYTGSHIGFFHFVDPDQDSLTLQAWSSNTVDKMCTIEAQREAKGQHYAVKLAGVWADAIRQRRPLIHNDYASLPDKKGMPDGHATLLRELVVPILRDGKVTAVLGVGNKATNYDDDDVVVVEQIATMVMDVVARKHAEDQLKQSNARLLEAQRVARLGHWTYEVGVDQLFVSEQINAIAGLDPGQTDMTLADSERQIHPDDLAIYRRNMDKAIRDGTPFQHEIRLARPDGLIRSVWATGSTTLDADGKVIRISGTIQDITDRVEAEARVRQAATVFDNTAEGITITDPAGNILAVNRAFTGITGYSEAEVLGQNPKVLKSGRHDVTYYRTMWSTLKEQGTWSGEIWNKRKTGEIYPEWLTINAVRDSEGRIVNYIAVFTDLSSRMALQAKLEYQSRHHELTGLLNSAGLLEQLRQACDTTAPGEQLALLVLNIDRFAQLNETLGRDRGDAVLIALARRWEALVGNDGNLSHMSADQFGLLLRDIVDSDSVLETAARILDSMRLPIELDGVDRPIALTLSIGVAFYPGDASEASALLHGAEEAMRQAKADKGNQVRFFDHAQAQRVRDWFETESALRGVLDRDELFLVYQPQVDTATGRIVAAEALLRWRQGDAVIPPGRFIHVVEGTDLAEPVSRWVLDSACRQARQWLDRQRPLRVAVNIFSEHVTSGHLVDDVAAVLARTGLPAQLLELEVVESSLLNNPEAAARTLRELKRMGVGLALDDFGTGYSSLGYLKHYPFDVLKIDQMFSRSITRDPEDAAIVRSTIALAHNLGMRVLAEGVETAPQLRFLARYGCDQLQGYLLSRPVDPAAVELRVMERRDLRPADLAGTANAPCLLVLEDEEVQATIITELLVEAGYRVRVAEDRDSAMRQVDSHAIDLIVADHFLKGITGVELLVELRRLYPEIPAIMVSSAEEQAVVVDAVNRAAIRGFLNKPVDDAELLRRIRDILGHSVGAPG